MQESNLVLIAGWIRWVGSRGIPKRSELFLHSQGWAATKACRPVGCSPIVIFGLESVISSSL